jgi:hypothetical protein
LYEDRFIKLFDDVMQNHEGVVAMDCWQSLALSDGAIMRVEAYNRMDGFGIFVTIRVVGRAHEAVGCGAANTVSEDSLYGTD